MHKHLVQSTLRRISAVTVSIIMLLSLMYPFSVAAESSPLQDETATTPTQTLPPAEASTPAADQKPPETPQPSQQTTEPTEVKPITPTPSNSDTTQPDAIPKATPAAPTTMSTNVAANTPTTHTSAETDTSLSNSIDSTAASGNAGAHQNTSVGDITSGNASALATIVNLLQSSVNLNGAQPIVFVQDVTGTVNGNLLIDPDALADSLESTAPLYGDGTTSNTDISVQALINNSINLNAASGNANASQNTTAGNVQSGSANAVANVVNLINSAINANQSFIGMINIYGNLNGDILVPAEFVNSVLGTGTSTSNAQEPIVTTDGNASVTNNINANAQSGSASSVSNSNSGSVGTGEANTKVTILNLTSSQTTSKNALLVFVNVMGKWVGLILDAPAGTTSASLGNSDATHNTTPEDTIHATSNLQINNTVNASATSGNASGTENTTVGNIQSGNANTGVNLLNILNSQISLSDWFGILFINVFGEWVGNFGTQTATVVKPPENNPEQPGSGQGGQGSQASGSNTRATLTFVATDDHQHGYSRTFRKSTSHHNTGITTDSNNTDDSNTSFYAPRSVMGSSTSDLANDRDTIKLQSDKKDPIENQGFQWWWVPLVIVALGLALQYYLVRRNEHNDSSTEI